MDGGKIHENQEKKLWAAKSSAWLVKEGDLDSQKVKLWSGAAGQDNLAF